MREWCSCGAGVWAFRKRDVVEWRERHQHSSGVSDVRVPPTGGDSRTEINYGQTDLGARIGFTPDR